MPGDITCCSGGCPARIPLTHPEMCCACHVIYTQLVHTTWSMSVQSSSVAVLDWKLHHGSENMTQH